MSYVMTLSELQTLAALLGAEHLLLAGEAGMLTRQTAVSAVFRLTQRGLLSPEGEGFRCEPETLQAVRTVAEAESCVLVSSPGLPQLMLYLRPDRFALTEEVPQRSGEYRLLCAPMDELPALLTERGCLPAEDAPVPEDKSAPVPPLRERKLEELGALPWLRAVFDRLDPGSGRQLERAAVLRWDGIDRLTVNDAPGAPWRLALLRELFTAWTGGRIL